MAAPKPQPTMATIVGNVDLHLRVVQAWMSPKGDVCMHDSPVIAWLIDPALDGPKPIGLGHRKGALTVVFDGSQKHWIDPATGAVFKTWAQVVAPMFEAHDAKPDKPTPPEPNVGHWERPKPPHRQAQRIYPQE